MKKESRDQILNALDHACGLTGFETFPAFLREAYRNAKNQLRLMKQARSRGGLDAILAKEPEPSPNQLEAMVKVIRLYPYALRTILTDAAKEAAKSLPHQPGGRPRVLNSHDYPKVCEAIGTLIAKGVKLKVAQQRVAERHGVSLRTIQRVWRKRSEIAQQYSGE
jgi:hypothetical protein